MTHADEAWIQAREREIRKAAQIPVEWALEIKTVPWLGNDAIVTFDKEKKTMELLIYSATFPASYWRWEEAITDWIKSEACAHNYW